MVVYLGLLVGLLTVRGGAVSRLFGLLEGPFPLAGLPRLALNLVLPCLVMPCLADISENPAFLKRNRGVVLGVRGDCGED